MTTNTHDIKRYLWWLNYAPHIAKVLPYRTVVDDISIFPELELAHEVIEAGRAAISAVKDAKLAKSLQNILIQNRPSRDEITVIKEAYKRQLSPNGEWADTSETIIIPSKNDVGFGKWPAKPVHQHETGGSIGTLTAHGVRLTKMKRRVLTDKNGDRKICPGCFYVRVQRLSKQILYEMYNNKHKLFWTETDEDAFDTLKKRWRQRRRRTSETVVYASYPQADDKRIVIHNQTKEGGEIVHDDKAKLFAWLSPIVQIQDSKNISASQGFGGDWQGNKGDGRVAKGIKPLSMQFVLSEESLTKLAAILNIATNDLSSLNMPAEDILRLLDTHRIKIHEKKNGRTRDDFENDLRALRKAEAEAKREAEAEVKHEAVL